MRYLQHQQRLLDTLIEITGRLRAAKRGWIGSAWSPAELAAAERMHKCALEDARAAGVDTREYERTEPVGVGRARR